MKLLASLFTGIIASVAAFLIFFSWTFFSNAELVDPMSISSGLSILASLIVSFFLLVISLVYGIYRQTKDKSSKNFSIIQVFIIVFSLLVMLVAIIFLAMRQIFKLF